MKRRRLRSAALLVACAGLLTTATPATASDDVSVVVTVRQATAERVAEYLRRKGFDVTPNDGRTLAARGRADLARAIRHPDVENVAGLGRRHRWHHRAVLAGYTGPALRTAYDVVAGDGSGLTVATVQFSGWDANDLDVYADAAGLPDPNPVEIAVAGAEPGTPSDGGDMEVALDQEVLLAAAPAADQRIYFAPNTGLGDAVLLYSRIASDAEAGLVDVVSTSWGMCEAMADQDPEGRAAIETQLARILAAGATIFAAAGDLGAYDCGDGTVSVDYPAASPHVVGVGGTTLVRDGAAWTETVWSDAATGLAGGGGHSSSVPRPAWQAGVGISGSTRLVPDVAAMADPRHGFGVYAAAHGGWLLAGGTSAGAPLLAGQLAAVLSAKGRTAGVGPIHQTLYTNTDAFRDVTSGGNFVYPATPGYDRASGLGSPRWSAVSAALFADPIVLAPAISRSRTVPLTVSPPPNATIAHWAVGEGTTLACDGTGPATPPASVTLAAGDRSTRVAVAALDANGTCRVGTAPVLLDSRAPVATGSIKAVRYDARTAIAWGAHDPSPSSGGLRYDVCVYQLGRGCVWSRTATAYRSATVSLRQGGTYLLRVTPVDRAGNRGARLSTGRHTVPIDQSALSRTGAWTRTASTYDWFGSHYGTAQRGATMSRTLAGTRYELLYLAHPKGGIVDVYVSGVLVKRVNTYASVKTYRKAVVARSYPTRAWRSVRLVVRSGYVAIDAVRVAY